MNILSVLAAWALPPAAVALVDVEAAKTLAATEAGVFVGGELGAMIGALTSSNEGDDSIGSVFFTPERRRLPLPRFLIQHQPTSIGETAAEGLAGARGGG